MKSWMTFTVTLLFLNSSFAAENPCKSDIQKFCSGLGPGGAIMKCLKQNESKLSVECKAFGQEMKTRFKQGREACADDVQKFCAKVKPGQKAILKCLKNHKAKLSQPCKDSVSRKI
ncbi:MAG: cysteine rich repeat-containing protein [Pseudobdellovibrionaceae bacterium]